MTGIEAIKAMTSDFITAADVVKAIGGDAQCLRAQAQQDKSKLGFPVVVIGRRVKIPRLPFIAYVTGESVEREEPS